MWEFWTEWWVWVVFGLALGVLEVLVPGYIFLGFAVGAVVTGGLVGFSVVGGNVALLVLIFAVLSLVAFLVLRRMVGVTEVQTKVWEDDING